MIEHPPEQRRLLVIIMAIVCFSGLGMVVLALFVIEGESPKEKRERTTFAVVGALLAVGGGIGGYFAWRTLRRGTQADTIADLSARAAFILPQQQRSISLLTVAAEIGDIYQIRAAKQATPLDASRMTAGQLTDWLWDIIDSDARSGGRPRIVQPLQLRKVAVIASAVTGVPADRIRLDTALEDLFPTSTRAEFWRRLKASGLTLPPLVVSESARSMLIGTALVVTFAIGIPAAISTDEAGVGSNMPRWLARVIVRGGFAVIFAGLAWVLIRFLGQYFLTFPRVLTNVATIAAAARVDGRERVTWSREEVWEEVRRVIARGHRVSESEVTLRTPLMRGH